MLAKRPTTARSMVTVTYHAYMFGLFIAVAIGIPEFYDYLGFKFDYHPALSFLIGVVIYSGLYGFIYFAQWTAGVQKKTEIQTFGIHRKIWPRNKHLKWMMFISICLLNPITEEVLFRGFVVFFGGHVFDNMLLAAAIGLSLSLLAHAYQGGAAIIFQLIFHGIAILILFSDFGLIACIGYHYAGDFIPLAKTFKNWRKIAPLHFRLMHKKTTTELNVTDPLASDNEPKSEIGMQIVGMLFLVLIAVAIYQIVALIILNNTSVSVTQLRLAVLFTIAALIIVSNFAKAKPRLWKTGTERNLRTPRMTNGGLFGMFLFGAVSLVMVASLIKDDEYIKTLLGIKHHHPFLLSFVVGLITALIFSTVHDMLIAKIGSKQKSQTTALLLMRTLWPRKTPFKIVMLIMYLALVPLTEELILRGVVIYALGSLTGYMPVVIFVGLIISVLMHLGKVDIASLIDNLLLAAISISLLLSPFGLIACIGFHSGTMSIAFWQFHRNWRSWLAQYPSSQVKHHY